LELFKEISLPEKEENYYHYIRYQRFIESRPLRENKRKRGFHWHHILPKSMGGEDTDSNLILLTPREHFIAHMILWKCGYPKMIHALWYMTHNGNNKICFTARQYESFYNDYIKSQPKGKNHPLHGSKKSAAHILKIIEFTSNRIHLYNPTTKENMLIKKDDSKLENYLELGFIKGRPWLSDIVSGEGNGMYNTSVVDIWKEKYPDTWEEHYNSWIESFKKVNKGKNNPMYGKNAYEKLSEDEYVCTMKKKEESMSKMWEFKRMLEEKNLKIKCIETNEIFDSLNEASNKVYKSNKKSGKIRNCVMDKISYRNFTWELVNE